MVSYPRTRPALEEWVGDTGSAVTIISGTPGSPSIPADTMFRREGMSDSVMALPYDEDHFMLLTKSTAGKMAVTGTSVKPTQPWKVRVFSNYSVFNERLHCPTAPGYDAGYYLTKALSNMDPGKPVVDLPLFIFEFKDFPRMLRDLGRFKMGQFKPSDIPDQVLAYNFGWAPLVSDLMGLLGLQKATSDRIKYLKSLAAGKPVQRRLTPKGGTPIDKNKYDGSWSIDDYFVGHCLGGQKHLTSTIEAWYSARPTLAYPLPSARDLPGFALRQVAGLTAQPERLWNFVPWTWLIDYFVNVGDYMSATGGLTRYKSGPINLMVHAKSTRTFTQLTSTGASLSGTLTQVGETKGRFVYTTPTPIIAQRPFLNNVQKANIGALSLSKVLNLAF